MFVSSVNGVAFRGVCYPPIRRKSNPQKQGSQNKSHSTAMMVGATAVGVAAVAGLAIAGKKGMLGSKIQKFLGGKAKEINRAQTGAPKPAAPKPEPPKAEVPKAESPKPAAPKTEPPKTESPKSEGRPKPESPKNDTATSAFVHPRETEVIKPYNLSNKKSDFVLNKTSTDPKTKNIIEEGVMSENGVKTSYTAFHKSDKGVMLKREDYSYPKGEHVRTFKYSKDGTYVDSVKEFDAADGKPVKETVFRKDGTVSTVAEFDKKTGNICKTQSYSEDGKTIKLNTIINPETNEAVQGKLPDTK